MMVDHFVPLLFISAQQMDMNTELKSFYNPASILVWMNVLFAWNHSSSE